MASPVARGKQIAGKLESTRRRFQQGTTLTGANSPAGAIAAGNNVNVVAGPNNLDMDMHPAKYFEEDPRDSYMEVKSAVAQKVAAGSSNLGTQVPVTRSDIDYIMDQRTKEEKLVFDQWKYSTYKPGSDPVRLRYFEKIDPSFFKDREEEIKKDLDVIRKLAKLSLKGPENEEDVLLLYGIRMGKIKVPNWKAHFPFEWFTLMRDVDLTETGLHQGYWNPRKFTNQYGEPQELELFTSNKPLEVLSGNQRDPGTFAQWAALTPPLDSML